MPNLASDFFLGGGGFQVNIVPNLTSEFFGGEGGSNHGGGVLSFLCCAKFVYWWIDEKTSGWLMDTLLLN